MFLNTLFSGTLLVLPIAVTGGIYVGVEFQRIMDLAKGGTGKIGSDGKPKITTDTYCQKAYGITPFPGRYIYNPNQWGDPDNTGALCLNVTSNSGVRAQEKAGSNWTTTWRYPQGPSTQHRFARSSFILSAIYKPLCLLQLSTSSPSTASIPGSLADSTSRPSLPTIPDPSIGPALTDTASPNLQNYNMSENGGTPQNKDEGSSDQHLNIKVTDSNNEVFFKIKKTTQLSKLMNAFCERQGKNMQSCRFMFDGQRVNPSDTPDVLDMQDGDMLEVFQEQIGGQGL